MIAGGIGKASERYETDYWRNSYKQGLDWIDANVEPKEGNLIGLGAGNSNLRWMIDPSRYQIVQFQDEADYYIGTTRYDECKVVPGRILHVVKADETPILYVIQPDTSYADDPFFDSPFRRDFEHAVERLRSQQSKRRWSSNHRSQLAGRRLRQFCLFSRSASSRVAAEGCVSDTALPLRFS